MATTISKYVDKCNEIYEAKPAYKNGASDTKECDCIGMDKYSFRQNNVSFSTTGTNWSMRNQVENVREISDALDLNIGDVVFKAYEPGDSGYNLPVKYQQGGSGYNGDLRDYYHIGTVRRVDPLEIIHMTSPTAKCDTKIGKWRFAANWKKEYISDSPDPGPEPPDPPQPPATETATVVCATGNSVKMRNKPTTRCNLYWDVPKGSIVVVKEKDIQNAGETWSKIVYAGITGYMMQKFLQFNDDPPAVTLWTVHIPHLTEEVAQGLIAQYPGSYMTSE